MDDASIKKVLEMLGANLSKKQGRSGWIISDCVFGPWSHDNGKSHPDAFGVRRGPGDNFCHCWSCGYAGDISDLPTDLYIKNKFNYVCDLPYADAGSVIDKGIEANPLTWEVPDIEQVLFGAEIDLDTPFPETIWNTFNLATGAIPAREYLTTRKIPEILWTAFDIRWDAIQRRVLMPVRDFDGTLMGIHGRAVDADNKLRYRMYTYKRSDGVEVTNPLIWLGEHWVDFDQPVVFVEGYFDLLSVYRVYPNVVSPLFANPSFLKLQRMNNADHIITLYDRGKGGDKGREKIDKWANGRKVTHIVPPEHRKDPGDMNVDEIGHELFDLVELRKKYLE